MKKAIALFIFLSIFIYFSFSFVNWELNPEIWKINMRVGFIFFMFLNLLISIIPINIEEK
jgi:ABC-type antimicrobial peptide transport system permease subunit